MNTDATTNVTNQQDDEELAKVLAGMNQQVGGAPDDAAQKSDAEVPQPPAIPPMPTVDAMGPASMPLPGQPDTPVMPPQPPVAQLQDTPPVQPEASTPPQAPEMPSMPEVPALEDEDKTTPENDVNKTPSALDTIKQEALGELRPLVDKLNVSAEEKFDTYLLLLRSTDDRELIAPAHEAAKKIEDESRRAQALLDIIKEIDFLSQNTQQPQ